MVASQSCGSDSCATDESCIDAACQCNTALYPFIQGSRPSPNVTCTGGKFNIQVSRCLLEKNSFNTSNMRLYGINSECFAAREVVGGIAEMTIHRPLITSDCSTLAVINKTHVTFTNKLYMFAKRNPVQIGIIKSVFCSYPLRVNVTLNVPMDPVLGTTVINGATGTGSYAALMMVYTDNTYTTLLSDYDTLTVEYIYLSVIVLDLDVKIFKLKVVNIYASPTNTSDQKYYLLRDRCPASDVPADQLTQTFNGVGNESRFAMKVFKIASSNTVYLYADLKLCTTDCTTTCSSRSKSDVSQNIAGRVSIFLNAADTIYTLDTSSASGFSMPWTLSALIFSWILVKLM